MLAANQQRGCRTRYEHHQPAPSREQCKRQHDSQMRLVDHHAEQDPGDDRPAIDQHQPAAEQGCGHRAVLSADRAHEQRRHRQRQQQRVRMAGEPERAIERVPGRAEPDEQRRHIGNDRQRQGQQQQHRRIGVVIVLDALRSDRLLEGMERGKVIDLGDAAVKREEGSGPIIYKVVAERTTEAVAQALSGLLQQVDEPGDGRKSRSITTRSAEAVPDSSAGQSPRPATAQDFSQLDLPRS